MAWYWIWLALVTLRLVWSLMPQSAYIHPDEFFQTVEIVAGDVLDIDVYRAWEFNELSPLRSMALPYLMFSWFFYVLRYSASWFSYTGLQLNGHMLLSGSRFIMAIFSLWIDFCVYRICKLVNLNHKIALFLTASSYVTLTYQCHTFTNSIETLLFVSLLYVVVQSVVGGRKIVNSSKKKMGTVLSHPNRCVSNWTVILIGFLLVCGVFNRPTFVLFSICPLFWWLHVRILPLLNDGKLVVLIKLAVVGMISVVFTFFIFLLFDSIYFSPNFLPELLSDVNICFSITLNFPQCLKAAVFNKGSFTPLNFINYNTKGDNLAEHGLHPFYLHFLVNLPLLFGPLIYFLILSLFNTLKYGMKKVKDISTGGVVSPANITSGNITIPYHLFVTLSVLLFSIFPHQEPRFLIPLLPLIILNYVRLISIKGGNLGKSFLSSWVIFNLCLSILYGSLHQGGVTRALFKLQEKIVDHTTERKLIQAKREITQIVFAHTYMPPNHLLLSKTGQTNVTDLKGCNTNALLQTLEGLQKDQETNPNLSSKGTFLICPSTFYKKFGKVKHPFRLSVVDKIFPHLSLEDPPDFSNLEIGNLTQFVEHLWENLSLYIVEVICT